MSLSTICTSGGIFESPISTMPMVPSGRRTGSSRSASKSASFTCFRRTLLSDSSLVIIHQIKFIAEDPCVAGDELMELGPLLDGGTHFGIVEQVFQAFEEIEPVGDDLRGVDHRDERRF